MDGKHGAFVSSVLLVSVWIISDPLFRYSGTWQLIINTVTNVVTFVKVFLIQRAQNKDSLAMDIKRSELLAAIKSDEMVAIENLSEAELRRLHAQYLELGHRGERPAPEVLEKGLSR